MLYSLAAAVFAVPAWPRDESAVAPWARLLRAPLPSDEVHAHLVVVLAPLVEVHNPARKFSSCFWRDQIPQHAIVWQDVISGIARSRGVNIFCER